MSEIRYNLVARDWVIIATERAKRPEDFKKAKKDTVPLPEYKDTCPFCPGNEGTAADETFRVGDAKSWKVRSIYNKYPALSPNETPDRVIDGFQNKINGFGIHEVMVENPKHNRTIALMDEKEVEDIIRMYRSRYVSIEGVKGVEAITIFKNHGPMAGCSQEHPHSQLVATPMVPPQIRTRAEEAAKFFDLAGKCVICYMLEKELKENKRIVLETDNFLCFAPYASPMPFTMFIVPKKHTGSFNEINDGEISDLALHLKTVLGKLYHGLGNPDFNYTIRSAPVQEKGRKYLHWHIVVVPRINEPAGFEIGTGIFINTTLPEACAEFLRNVSI